jgi:prepilin-type N-terminal cleavage/methylation domain-containing protein
MSNNLKNKQGFTLIEVLIAIAVFTIGIMGAFGLALSNINTVKDNFNRVLSANLSREGLEIVRNIRDSNWLKMEANEDCESGIGGLQICNWAQNLDPGFYYADYNDLSLTPSSCSNLDTCISSCTSAAICSLYLNTGVYDHGISSFKSNMSRIIQIENICMTDSGGAPVEDYRDVSCDKSIGEDHAGIRVTSRVRWTGETSIIDIDSSELMYNWRR